MYSWGCGDMDLGVTVLKVVSEMVDLEARLFGEWEEGELQKWNQ